MKVVDYDEEVVVVDDDYCYDDFQCHSIDLLYCCYLIQYLVTYGDYCPELLMYSNQDLMNTVRENEYLIIVQGYIRFIN